MRPARLFLCFLACLAACSQFQRADDAAAAKINMIGWPREDVLACMGPPRKKAAEGSTEVWSYLSTDGSGTSTGTTLKGTSYQLSNGSHGHAFCTVNVVMTNGLVSRVNYNGPASGFMAPDEQCGYAVANCVHGDK